MLGDFSVDWVCWLGCGLVWLFLIESCDVCVICLPLLVSYLVIVSFWFRVFWLFVVLLCVCVFLLLFF